MSGVLQNIGCEPILSRKSRSYPFTFSRTVTIAGLVEEAKTGPAKRMKDQGLAFGDFSWPGSYGAFAVSPLNVEQSSKLWAAASSFSARNR